MFQTGGGSRSGLVLPFLSFFVLFCPFWDFPDFSGIFAICSGMVRGFSRFVPFLFLGLLRAPTRNSPERVRDTIWTFPEKSGKHPGLETPRLSFSQHPGPRSIVDLASFSGKNRQVHNGGDQYDWTTGGPYDGNERTKSSVVLRAHPLRHCVFAYFNRPGSKGAFRLPGRRGVTSVVRWNLPLVIVCVERWSGGSL